MKPRAVFVSDLHLQTRVPRARAEESWFDVMRDRINLLKGIAQGAPIFCAGDVFDHWAPGPELINFAIQSLPYLWTIPGQHDLPGHNYEGRHRGAYHTLELADRICDMPPGRLPLELLPAELEDARVYCAPWGFDIPGPEPEDEDHFKILIAHRFVADSPETAYMDAPPTAFLTGALARACEKYDLAVFGDNHKGFTAKLRGCTVFNHGGFIPRNADEMNYAPQVGILDEDYKFITKRLILEADWKPQNQSTPKERVLLEYSDYIESCRNLREAQVPFLDRLGQIAATADAGVASVIRAVKEHCSGDNKQSI